MGAMHVGVVLGGRYRLLAKLGAGGMGSVWRATDLTLDSEVVIKLMGEELAGSGEAAARFRREARAAAAIRSSHVVQILDYGVDGLVPYIAMELLRGESLAERLERVVRLPPEETAHLLGHVARALTLAHQNGIVHRDLKPDNIYIVREGDEDIGKVLDFGIARRREGLTEVGGLATRTGAILGTPYYMSPEQAMGEPVDELTDIWAFGVIACECLTGQRPFQGDSLGALFRSVCIAEIPRPSALGPVPAAFDAWFARAVARDKPQRIPNVRQAADELRRVCGRSGSFESMPGSISHASTAAAVTAPASFGTASDARAPAVSDRSALPSGGVPDRTAPAATNSVMSSAGGEKSRASLLVALTLPVLLAASGYAGWRALQSEPVATTAAPSAVTPPPVSVEPSAPPVVVPAPTPTLAPVPAPVASSTASTLAASVAPSATPTSKPAPAVRARPAQAATQPATPKTSEPAPPPPLPLPTTVKPAATTAKKPAFRSLIDDRQ
jgi:eukaryotic-like serine/threonine-protein kinase